MANDLRANPWYFDSVGSAVPPQWGKVYVKEIRWENYAVGDQLVIDDGVGNTLVNETIGAGNTYFGPIKFGAFGWVNGFNVTTISAGSNITVTITKA